MRQVAHPDEAYRAAAQRVDAALIRSRLWLITSRAKSEADSWQRAWGRAGH